MRLRKTACLGIPSFIVWGIVFLTSILQQAEAISLVRITDSWHYQAAEAWVTEAETENTELRAWTKPDFDDRNWIVARGGFVGGPTLLSQATRLPNFGLSTQTSLFRQNNEIVRQFTLWPPNYIYKDKYTICI